MVFPFSPFLSKTLSLFCIFEHLILVCPYFPQSKQVKLDALGSYFFGNLLCDEPLSFFFSFLQEFGKLFG